MSDSWGLLDEKEELELHKSRLLSVEERPFKRISKRVSNISNLVSSTVSLKASDTEKPQGPDAAVKPDTTQLKEDITIDFAFFDHTIRRFQLLHNANLQEREKYARDQENILRESQSAREKNANLRDQLAEAQATLAQRKKFDEMAEKITSNRLLKPREDQVANLAKLEEECRELERESETYSSTWAERRNQFNKIMEEGIRLRRQIRDEKEEVDRREGMNEGEDDDAAAPTPRPDQSGDATPLPGGDAQHRGEVDGEPVGTPAREGSAQPGLRPPQGAPGTRSRSGSRQPPSRDATPAPKVVQSAAREEEEIDREDEDMEDKESGAVTEDGMAPGGDEDRMEVDR